ncbi:MAG TPA: branched-chain amino acid ABC transporter permease [Ktedonobacterales bacterium]|nr:branched-chain amino acid ABC transporter permease [Ktedonobacterales bacterium]
MLMILADSASNFSRLLQVIENGITTGAIYALIALGYTMVYGIIQLINFAHGDVFMWGTVVMYFVLQWLHVGSSVGNVFELVGLVFGLMLLCMIVCALIAVVLERVAYRPLRNAPRLAPLISAIGASFVLENVALFLIGSQNNFVPNLFPNAGWTILGVTVKYLDVFIIILAVVLMYGLAIFINRTRVGRAMRSVSQDREAASLMGVNIDQIIVLTFVIGGLLAGAASVVYAMSTLTAYFFTGFKVGLTAFTAAVVGGIGNIYGAMLGGLFIGLVESFVINYVQDGEAWADAIVFAALVLVLVFRPAGFLGQSAPEKV